MIAFKILVTVSFVSMLSGAALMIADISGMLRADPPGWLVGALWMGPPFIWAVLIGLSAIARLWGIG